MRCIKGMIVAGLWLLASHVSAFGSTPAAHPLPKVVVVRDDRPPPYHATPAQVTLLRTMASKDGEKNALLRCIDYPDPPGTHWNHGTVVAMCSYMHSYPTTLDQLDSMFKTGGPALLTKYFDILKHEQSIGMSSWNLDKAFEDTFGCACKASRDLADAWKARAPDSSWAYVASGVAYSAAAVATRGTDTFQKTPAANIARMEELDARAAVDLGRALELDPDATPAMISMISVDRREGRSQEARNRLADALRKHPDNLMLHEGAALVAMPNWGGSDSELQHERERALAASTTNPLLVLVVSEIDWNQRQCGCEWSMDDYKAMNQIGPSLAVLRAAAGKANQTGDYAGAAIYATELFRFSSTHEIWAHVQRGLARKDMGDLDGAQEDVETALAEQPDYAPALGLARMLTYMRPGAVRH